MTREIFQNVVKVVTKGRIAEQKTSHVLQSIVFYSHEKFGGDLIVHHNFGQNSNFAHGFSMRCRKTMNPHRRPSVGATIRQQRVVAELHDP